MHARLTCVSVYIFAYMYAEFTCVCIYVYMYVR